MARVGLDIDDVIYPWFDRAHSICVDAGITNGVTPTSYAPYLEYGVERDVWGEVLELAAESLYDAAPLPGALEAIHALEDAGHEVIFVTARGSFGRTEQAREAVRSWTHDWLAKWGLSRFELIFTRDKTTANVHYLLDDVVEHVEACRSAGTVAFLRTRPWNEHAFDLPRVADIRGFVALLLCEPSDGRLCEPSDARWHDTYLNPPLPVGPAATLIDQLKVREPVTFPGHGPVVDRSEVRVTSPTGGQKGKKLARLGSIDPVALKAVAEVSGFGAEKYAAFNFLRGYDWSLSYDALQRHLGEAWSGVELDDESGLPHLAHAAWHCLALLSFSIRGLGTDDRPARALEQFARELEATQRAVAATLEGGGR